LNPTARSIALFGERATPCVMSRLLRLSDMAFLPTIEFDSTVLVHPDINPVAFKLGPLAVRWYGLMYLAGFAAGWWLGVRRIKAGAAPITRVQFDDVLFYAVLGVILGGRLGYVLFYKPGYYLSHPLEIFAVWHGGMSFHGGFLGVLVAMAFAARKFGVNWWSLMDFVAPLVPIGLAAGRLGNFINGELWGRVTTLPWGMVFPGAGPLPRHPSELYEFVLEGVALFAILWWFSSKPRPRGQVSALFLVGYGTFRFIAEFAREPDDFLGYLALHLTMGQWLSLPMIVAGVALFAWTRRQG
jgi:phosphatidylglycerol:prolipoprotein diacylglycerol transferase